MQNKLRLKIIIDFVTQDRSIVVANLDVDPNEIVAVQYDAGIPGADEMLLFTRGGGRFRVHPDSEGAVISIVERAMTA